MSLYTDYYVTKYLLEGMDCKRRELSKKFMSKHELFSRMKVINFANLHVVMTNS